MSWTKATYSLTEQMINHICPSNDPRIYWANEVTFDYGSGEQIRVDIMLFKPLNNSVSGIEKGDFYCYEVKSSVTDFHSKHGHNFIGDFNYYVMTPEVYEEVKSEIPYNVGVYISENVFLQGEKSSYVDMKCVKKAKRVDRKRPVSEMLLMMWRSSRRELVKLQRTAG